MSPDGSPDRYLGGPLGGFLDGPAGTRIDEADLTVVDVETTGLSADRGDRICEIGVVRLRGSAVMETFGTLVDPTIPISAGAYAVNGISPAMLAGAPVFGQVMGRVAAMLEGSVLAAYNAPFDVGFLRSEFRLAGERLPSTPVLDVLALARRLLPGRRRYPQASVADLLRISSPVRHRALEDAMVTAKILAHFISMLKAFGIVRLDELLGPGAATGAARMRNDQILRAIQGGGDLWIRYLSPTDGEVTQRIVTPLRGPAAAVRDPGGGDLDAFCHVLQARKRFRIAYILDARPVTPGTL